MSSMSAAELRQVAASLLEQAQVGDATPTITELARRSGLPAPRCTATIPTSSPNSSLKCARDQATPRPLQPTHHLPARIAKLRQENEELRLHVEHYEEHIRAPYSRKQPALREVGATGQSGPTSLHAVDKTTSSPDDLPICRLRRPSWATRCSRASRSCGLVAFFGRPWQCQ